MEGGDATELQAWHLWKQGDVGSTQNVHQLKPKLMIQSDLIYLQISQLLETGKRIQYAKINVVLKSRGRLTDESSLQMHFNATVAPYFHSMF